MPQLTRLVFPVACDDLKARQGLGRLDDGSQQLQFPLPKGSSAPTCLPPYDANFFLTPSPIPIQR